jgi:hypothetical protein
MAIPSWPASLPQSPQKGYTETGGVLVVRTPTDRGPAKSRYVGSKPQNLSIQFLMTTDQVTTFENFVNSSVLSGGISGVNRFNFTHPRTSATVEVRIVPQGEGDFYTLTYVAPGYYTVALTLEVLP